MTDTQRQQAQEDVDYDLRRREDEDYREDDE